jgi:hypothetical protein
MPLDLAGRLQLVAGLYMHPYMIAGSDYCMLEGIVVLILTISGIRSISFKRRLIVARGNVDNISNQGSPSVMNGH